MAVGVYSWSTTASSNGSASSAINFAEGQSPASLNNSARAMMAEVAAWLSALGGGITYGGSADAYTATHNAVGAWSAYASGQVILLVPGATNTGASTLNVDGLGTKAICKGASTALSAGDLTSGFSYLLRYDGVRFVIIGSTSAGFQPLDATLTALAAVTYGGSGSPVLQWTAADTVSLTLAPSVTTIELGHASDTTLSRSAAGVLAVEGVDLVSVSGSQTLTNKTLTSPTINGGTASTTLQLSSETTGTLTSASANKKILATGGITLPNSVFAAQQWIIIEGNGTARTITRGSGVTMYINGTNSATGTLTANGIMGVHWRDASICILTGDVS